MPAAAAHAEHPVGTAVDRSARAAHSLHPLSRAAPPLLAAAPLATPPEPARASLPTAPPCAECRAVQSPPATPPDTAAAARGCRMPTAPATGRYLFPEPTGDETGFLPAAVPADRCLARSPSRREPAPRSARSA